MKPSLRSALIGIGIFLTVLVGFVWWRGTGLKNITLVTSPKLNSSPPSAFPSPSPATKKPPTADWGKFDRSDQYGFSFFYPANYNAVSHGPNEFQRRLNRGETISGTVRPSLEDITFSAKDDDHSFGISIYGLSGDKLDQPTFDGGCGSQFATNVSIKTGNFNSLPYVEIIQDTGTTFTVEYCFLSGLNQMVTLHTGSGEYSRYAYEDSARLLKSVLVTVELYYHDRHPSEVNTSVRLFDSRYSLGEKSIMQATVQDGSYYGPPFEHDRYQLEVADSIHYFAKSNSIDLAAYLGRQITVSYRPVQGLVMGEQPMVIVDSIITKSAS